MWGGLAAPAPGAPPPPPAPLWTPHRIAYIEQGPAAAGDECVFCTAPTLTDEQALIVHRGELGYVLLNLFPYNSGHLLVVPSPHVALDDEAGQRRESVHRKPAEYRAERQTGVPVGASFRKQ